MDGGCGGRAIRVRLTASHGGPPSGSNSAEKRTAGLTQQRPAAAWTENKVRVLSTELILERLAGFGIVTSVDEVVQQARAEHVASAIAEGWRERFPVSPHSVDDDFVDLAARVLWERLLPERRSFEQLDARMQAGYGAFLANDVVRACDEWLEVWEGFKPHFEPEMTHVRDVDAMFHGTEYFFNWCQEFEHELGNAGAVDPRYLRARVRYVNEFMAQFGAEADEVELMGNFLRAEAVALWSLGEPAAAEERFEALIRRYPQFAWGHIGLADCFWLGPDPMPEPKEYARAEGIYQRALAEPALEMRADVLDRLADLHLEQGNTDAAAVWRQQAEVERRQWLGPLFPERAVTPSIMAGATHKLGRNDGAGAAAA